MAQKLRNENEYDLYFNPEDFLNTYYKQIGSHTYLKFALESLHTIYTKGNIKGKRLLDIGCGPCIHAIMPAAKWFDEIILSDIAECNRVMETKWLNRQEGAKDWTAFFKYYSQLNGNEDEWQNLESEVRKKIRDVVPCNIHLDNPLYGQKFDKVDAITASLCLESACPDIPSYIQALKNIVSVLKPGGKLVLIGILNNSFYIIGIEKFVSLSLTKKDVIYAVESAGLRIIVSFDDESYSNDEIVPYNGSFVLVAEK